jgi:hypothetical protein
MILIPISIFIIITLWINITSRSRVISKIMTTYVILAIVFVLILLSQANCSLYPFSSYSCYECGYIHGLGKELDK